MTPDELEQWLTYSELIFCLQFPKIVQYLSYRSLILLTRQIVVTKLAKVRQTLGTRVLFRSKHVMLHHAPRNVISTPLAQRHMIRR